MTEKGNVTRRKLLVGLGLALVILLIAGVNVYHNRQGVQISVRVAPVENLQLENVVLATGTVHPVEQQKFYAPGATTVAEVLVREGDRVEAGQVLGRLDEAPFLKEVRDAESLLAQAEAQVRQAERQLEAAHRRAERLRDPETDTTAELRIEAARRQLERLRYLHEHGAATAVEMEQAEQELELQRAAWRTELESAELEVVRWGGELESARARQEALVTGPDAPEREALAAQVEQARAALEIARDRLARATLRAAADGVVWQVDMESGKPVAANAFLLSVVDLERVEIRAEVSEADAGLLAVGQAVRVQSVALPGELFHGEVARIAPGTILKTGSQGEQNVVSVVVGVTDTGARLRPGYSVDLEIVTVPRRDVPAVPYEAVVEEDDGTWVFVVEGDRVTRREVEVRRGNELYEEIISGLQVGEKVVVGPPERLRDGDRVRVPRDGKRER